MNLIIIVLSVSVIFLLFILFRYFSNNSTKLAEQSTLLTTNAVIAVTSNPSATRYAFGIWIYVKSWNNNIEPIFEFPGKIKLYLDASALRKRLQNPQNTKPNRKDTVERNKSVDPIPGRSTVGL